MADSTEKSKLLKDIARFKLMDDTFMSAAFDGQIPETQLLIRSIIGDDTIRVVSSKAQYTISNTYGHEVRIDILAFDKEGKAYHFEIQRDRKHANARRARFTAALVDTTLLSKGGDYENLPDRYTIFITAGDYFGKGLPVYRAENRIEDLGNIPLGDGGHIVYVNTTYKNTDTPIGKLIHDFKCVNPDNMINPILRERVRYLKREEEGKKTMCDIMENRIREDRIECARKAIADGEFSTEQIAKILNLPLATVRKLANSNSKTV